MSAQTNFDLYIEKSSQLLKCLADKNRLSVFAILTYGDYTVSEMYLCLNLPQNLISHHLKQLRQAGLVRNVRRGRQIYYSLNKKTLSEVDTVLKKIMSPIYH